MIEEGGTISVGAEKPPSLLVPGTRQRLHPLTMVTRLGDALKQAWGAAVAAAYFIYSGEYLIVALIVGVLLVSSLARPLIMWLTFTYEVSEDGIELRSGLVNRTHRTIPFERVQDVNLEQNILHRLLSMGKVKLETGGSAGGKSEDGVIDSISLEDAARLRDTIRALRTGSHTTAATPGAKAPTEDRSVFAMDTRRVLLAGVFNFSLAVIGVLFGAAQTVGDLFGVNPFSGTFWRTIAADSTPFLDFLFAHRIVAVIFGFLSLVLVGLATGLIQTLLREHGFRLERTETGFRRRRGLLTLTDVVLPLARVQAVIVATGPVRRSFGYAALKLQSLARDSGHGGDHVVAPLATAGEIDIIVEAMDWRAIDRSERVWRGPTFAYVVSFLMIVVPATVLGLVSATFSQSAPAAVTALLAAGIITLLRILAWRYHGYRRDGDRLEIRSGAWAQRRVLLPVDRIQSVDIHRNPIDRLFGVASLVFGVAGGRGFSKHAILSIPRADAFSLRAQLIDDTQ